MPAPIIPALERAAQKALDRKQACAEALWVSRELLTVLIANALAAAYDNRTPVEGLATALRLVASAGDFPTGLSTFEGLVQDHSVFREDGEIFAAFHAWRDAVREYITANAVSAAISAAAANRQAFDD